MDNLILHQIQRLAKARGWKDFFLAFETEFIETEQWHKQLDPNSLYFLYEYGSIYETARVIISSSTNILIFTKDFRPRSLNYFSDYLNVKYENGQFVPFYLTFLKAVPYV